MMHVPVEGYQHVYLNEEGDTKYIAIIWKYRYRKSFDNAKEAAKAVDRKLMERGEAPVNVFKPVNKKVEPKNK